MDVEPSWSLNCCCHSCLQPADVIAACGGDRPWQSGQQRHRNSPVGQRLC